jgi:hypothetical protein
MKKYLFIVAALIVTVSAVATASATANTTPEPGDCVTQEAYTETTDWVTESPGAEWYQVDERTVVDSEPTEDAWTNMVWHVYAGNNNSDDPPAVDDPHWQATGGDPQSENHAFENHTPNVPYSVDAANGRGSDWFLWTATFVPGQEEVTHQEFVFALDHAAVECPGVTTASATAIQPSCENEGEYGLLLGNEDEIDYLVEGTILPGETVSVTAVAKEGVELEGQDEFKITFDSFDAADCESTPPGDPDDGGVSASSPDVDPAVTSTLTSNRGELPFTR